MKKFLLIAILLFTAFSLHAENPRYKISVTHGGDINMGDIVIELYADAAPKHTARFDSLVSVGFYNTTAFHRVIPGIMIQGGGINSRTDMNKPRNTWGQSTPGFPTVPAEFSKTLKHLPGIISGARTTDPNSFTSQFFICVDTAKHLDGQYSIFGEVVSGMDVVNEIVNLPRDGSDNPFGKVEMWIEKLSGTSVAGQDQNLEFHLKTYPNPADNSSKISFMLLKNELVKVDVVNALGEKVVMLFNGELAEGRHEFIWDTGKIAEGNYFYTLETSAGITTGKIIIKR
jgi:cyclophilin family peptidyl-prolyl cis-trans isomerase